MVDAKAILDLFLGTGGIHHWVLRTAQDLAHQFVHVQRALDVGHGGEDLHRLGLRGLAIGVGGAFLFG